MAVGTYYTIYIDSQYSMIFGKSGDTTGRHTILSGSLTTNIGSAASLEFTIPKGHMYYDKGNLMTSSVSVWEDNIMVFWGRITEISYDFYGSKTYYCEGALAFLNDTVQPDVEYEQVSIRNLFKDIIKNHNDQVAENRKLEIGEITVDNRKLTDKNLTRQMSYSALTSMCTNVEGGYLIVRDGNYIDWLKTIDGESFTNIRYGVNLIDIKQNINVSDIKTVVVATGTLVSTKIKDGEEKEVREEIVTTVESKAVSTYGKIYTVQDFGDVTEMSQLAKVAKTWINLQQSNTMSIDLTEVELTPLNREEYRPIELAENVVIYSDYHDIIATLPVTKISYDLLSCTKNLTLGGYNPNNKDLSSIIARKDKSESISYDSSYDDQDEEIDDIDDIFIEKPPDKLSYNSGEYYDWTGLIVKALYKNDDEIDITSSCIISPSNGSMVTAESSGSKRVSVTYREFEVYFDVDIIVIVPYQLIIDTMPERITYRAGLTLDYTGLKVLCEYTDGNREEVTYYCSYDPMNGTEAIAPQEGTTVPVTVTYTTGTTTLIASFNLTVIEIKSIAITTNPTKMIYEVSDPIDYNGIAVTAAFTDDTTEIVTDECIFNPLNGTTVWEIGTVSSTITYGNFSANLTFTVTGKDGSDDSTVGVFDLKYVIYTISGTIITLTGLNIENIMADNLQSLEIPSIFEIDGIKYNIYIN